MVDGSVVTQSCLVMDSFIQVLRGGRFGSYTEWFSDGQLHTVAFVVDGSAVTQSGLVMDSFIQCLSWWTVRQLHRVV
jgi:hypothetical protein